MINTTWENFKQYADSYIDRLQYVIDENNNYRLYISNEGFEVCCLIAISTPANSDQLDFETNYKPQSNQDGNSKAKVTQYPFSDKVLPNGKKMFTRIHGVSSTITSSPSSIDFEVPYDSCKITGIEIMGGSIGDMVDFEVVDTSTGTISGVPNLSLNKFGHDVNVSKDLYKYKSSYDADLIKGMKLRIVYNTSEPSKAVYINLILHQVV